MPSDFLNGVPGIPGAPEYGAPVQRFHAYDRVEVVRGGIRLAPLRVMMVKRGDPTRYLLDGYPEWVYDWMLDPA